MRPRPDHRVELVLASTGERTAVDLDAGMVHGEGGRPRWSDYLAGMAAALVDAGGEAHGFDGLLASDLPIGAGLSSSAALEVACAWALGGGGRPRRIRWRSPARPARGKRVRRRPVRPPGPVRRRVRGRGLPRSCSTAVRSNIDRSRSRQERRSSSRIRAIRELRGSGYEQRRLECEAAAAALAAIDPSVRALRDVTPELLEQARDRLDEGLLAAPAMS